MSEEEGGIDAPMLGDTEREGEELLLDNAPPPLFLCGETTPRLGERSGGVIAAAAMVC